MNTKLIKLIIFRLLALGLLTSCAVDAPAGRSQIRPNQAERSVNVVVELPTEVVANRDQVANAVQAIAEDQDVVAELQVTVSALDQTVSELTAETNSSIATEAGDDGEHPAAEPAGLGQSDASATDQTSEAVDATPMQSIPPEPTAVPLIVASDMESLEAKFSSAVPDENGQITVVVSESEINAVFQSLDQRGQQDVISNVYIDFTVGYIQFDADITKPRTGHLFIRFLPYVSGGGLQFDAIEASFDGARVPPAALNSAEATLNNILGEAVSQFPGNVLLTNIIMTEESMTIIGQVQN